MSNEDAWLHFADAVLAQRAIAHGAESQVSAADLEDALVIARKELHDSLESDAPFAMLAANAGLALVDVEVLAVAAAIESSRSRLSLLGIISPSDVRQRLTIDSVRVLLGQDHVMVLAPDGALSRSALVEVIDEGTWSEQVVSVHRTVLWALFGNYAPDPDVPVDASIVTTDQPDGHALVVVAGTDRMRRRQAASMHSRGTRFLVTPLPASAVEWSAVVREATLIGSGVIVEIEESFPDLARRWINRAGHLTWAISSPHDVAVADLPQRPWVEVDVGEPATTSAEQTSLLGDAGGTHKLTLDQLHTVAGVLPARGGDLAAAVRRLGSGRLEKLARRIRPTRTWDDIVLTDEQRQQLDSVIARYRFAHRVYGDWGFSAQPSTGIVAMFAGASGTGKTLAAEIVAGELSLDVFKLDLSSVVSKYIGETEKNLEEVFNAASAGNMVLFFDEADSLFGKRSEVRDAHDRYANIEVSYLLQRLESYEGLVDLGHQLREEHRRGVPAPRARACRVPTSRGGPAREDLATQPPRRRAGGRRRPAVAGGAVRGDGCNDSQRCHSHRVRRGSRRHGHHHGRAHRGRRPGVPEGRPLAEARALRTERGGVDVVMHGDATWVYGCAPGGTP